MKERLLTDALRETIGLQVGKDEGSRADYVYKALRMVILAGQFRGDRVREEEIAEVLGVSRTPVREALGRLQANGLLEMAPRRGLSVPRMSRPQVLELYGMREILEGAAARFAAQHAAESEVGLLRKLIADPTIHEGDASHVAAVNRTFHHAIYDAAHNRYLLGTLGEIYDSMTLLGATTFTAPGRSRMAWHEHEAIVDAIASRKPDKAERAAREHIQKAMHTRLEMLAPE